MRSFALQAGSADQTVRVRAYVASTGLPKTGLAFDTSGLVCYYSRRNAAATAITLATQTVTGGHSDGGFVEIHGTNMPGEYRLDLPDAVVATGVAFASVILSGVSDTVFEPIHIDLPTYDPNAAGPTAGDIADAVHDEALSGHTTAGTLGKAIADIETDVDAVLVDTGTTLQAELDGIQADTEDIQSRLPASLTAGRINANVGAMEANVLTATAINADAITAAKVAADVGTEIGAAVLAAAAADPIDANVEQINTVPIVGDGSATPFNV